MRMGGMRTATTKPTLSRRRRRSRPRTRRPLHLSRRLTKRPRSKHPTNLRGVVTSQLQHPAQAQRLQLALPLPAHPVFWQNVTRAWFELFILAWLMRWPNVASKANALLKFKHPWKLPAKSWKSAVLRTRMQTALNSPYPSHSRQASPSKEGCSPSCSCARSGAASNSCRLEGGLGSTLSLHKSSWQVLIWRKPRWWISSLPHPCRTSPF